MRSRNIKPGFFKNEYLAECEPLARILFSGLWCMADREGRLEYRPKRIKAELLPYDDCNVESLLNQLLQYGLITIYSVDGSNYISIPTFTEHQNPNVKEAASIIPAPNEHGASTVLVLPLTDSLKPLTENLLPLDVTSAKKTRSRHNADIINFNFETRTWENITQGDMEPWQGAYPACDILVELNAMREWLLSNPEKRKVKYRKFITGWLSRQQQRGGTGTKVEKSYREGVRL